MADLIKAWIDFLSKPLTVRRTVSVVILVAGIIAALLLFERCTSTFRLARLQKAADLWVRLQEIESNNTNRSPELDRVRKALMEQSAQLMEETPVSWEFITSRFSLTRDAFWKFLAGAAIWIAGSIFLFLDSKTVHRRKELFGNLAFAAVPGLVAMFVPTIWWPWFHILIFPCLFVVGLVLCTMPIAFIYIMESGLKGARRKAQSIVCINNLRQVGLAARQFAAQHHEKLPTELHPIRSAPKDEHVTCCPSDKRVQYAILSPGASEADPWVAYARCPIHDNILLTDGSVHQLGERELVQQDGWWKIE